MAEVIVAHEPSDREHSIGSQRGAGTVFIVMCRISGGVTGTHEGPLKALGTIRRFETEDEAVAVAVRLDRDRNGDPRRTADYRYWVENADVLR